MKGFTEFIKKQGVLGLAVGFILGGAISKVVSSIVEDLVNPILGLVLGTAKGLETFVIQVGPANVKLGHFLGVIIDFLVIALVVYFGVMILKFEWMTKKDLKQEDISKKA